MFDRSTKIVVANWKMFGDFEFTIHYFKHLCNEMLDENLKVIICPPYPYINIAYRILVENENEQICLGAQNISHLTKQQSTGEINSKMLEESGSKFVIIGHSERREIGENNEIVNQKIKNTLNSSLCPILCVGESKSIKEDNKTKEFIKNQIITALNEVKNIDTLLIAYEPIWAIGSGNIPTESEINEIANLIQQTANECCKINNLYILYGGSVNGANIKQILKINNIDGVLIGSYSTQTHEFCETLSHLNIAELV